jgi:hypothetical protein
MHLLREVNDEIEGIQPAVEPAVPVAWSVGHLGHHGLILSCDGFTVKLDGEEMQKFFDIAEDGEIGEINDQNGDLILVEPTENSIILTRTGDKVYPSGITLDLVTLKELGIEQGKEDEEAEKTAEPEEAMEGVKYAYRRAGKKIKRGFRVTSGYRKGRVVASMKTAYKPRARASTRMKLSIAGRKKKFVRLLKSKRTRKKSLSKRLARMNKR